MDDLRQICDFQAMLTAAALVNRKSAAGKDGRVANISIADATSDPEERTTSHFGAGLGGGRGGMNRNGMNAVPTND